MSFGDPVEEIGSEDDLYRRLIPSSVNRHGVVVASAFYARGMVPDPEISRHCRLSTAAQSLARGRPGKHRRILAVVEATSAIGQGDRILADVPPTLYPVLSIRATQFVCLDGSRGS